MYLSVEPEFEGGQVVRLTPFGFVAWNRLLQECSAIAGREIGPDELLDIVHRVRTRFGMPYDAEFAPAMIEALERELENLRTDGR